MSFGSVLVIGDVFVDWIVRVATYPRRAGNVNTSAPELHGGGTAANVAVGLTRLGLPVTFVSKIGDDVYGRFLQADLSQSGLDTHQVLIDATTYTPVVIAVVDGEGERTFLACAEDAAHTQLRPEEFQPALLDQTAWLHTTGVCFVGGTSPATLLQAMTLAKERAIPVSLDVNLRLQGDIFPEFLRAGLEKAIAVADVIFASVEEIKLLAPAATFEESARQLAGLDRVVVARQGAKGALAISAGETITVSAFPTQVVDLLGAGDAFDAGFIAAQVQGEPVREALRWGNAVAALKIAQPGGRSLPDQTAVKQVLNRIIKENL